MKKILDTRSKKQHKNFNEMKQVKIVGMGHEFGSIIQKNRDVEEKYRLESNFIFNKTGVERRHVWDGSEKVSVPERAWAKAEVLLADRGMDRSNISAIFGASNSFGSLSIPSSTHEFVTHGKLYDKSVSHINYGCGGYFSAIELMYFWLMGQEEGTRAILVLMDWPSSMVHNYQTEVLFSDALHVSIWSNTNSDPGIVIERPFSAMAEGDIMGLFVKNGFWEMDGSSVSTFVRRVPELVMEKMDIRSLEPYDIVPHQPNVRLLETLEKDYGVPFYKEVVRKHGNPTCSGTMIALEHFMDTHEGGKSILAMGFGDSLSYGAMIVRR